MNIICLMEDQKKEGACYAEHGLSFYIKTKENTVLFDFGQSEKTLLNAQMLSIDLKKVEVCVLSHGHYDHSGGILPFLKINHTAPIYVQKDAKNAYYNAKHTPFKYIGIDQNIVNNPQIHWLDKNMEIGKNLYVFQNIVTTYPIPNSNNNLKEKVDNTFVQDAFAHEQCLYIKEGEKRVLLSGCAHHGILNVLHTFYALYHCYPTHVISGFHLKKDAYLEQDIADIKALGQQLLGTKALFFSGHCTGDVPFQILKSVMGEQLQNMWSGKKLI